MRPVLFSLLAVPVLAAGIVFSACSDEGEGQPCSLQNGSNDCQSNLTCQTVPNANGPRCCPTDLSQATTPECSLPNGGVDASPAPPDVSTDTSSQDSPGEAAPGDAATDAPADGASDARTESAADGTPD
jgi:hypothetical protein